MIALNESPGVASFYFGGLPVHRDVFGVPHLPKILYAVIVSLFVDMVNVLTLLYSIIGKCFAPDNVRPLNAPVVQAAMIQGRGMLPGLGRSYRAAHIPIDAPFATFPCGAIYSGRSSFSLVPSFLALFKSRRCSNSCDVGVSQRISRVSSSLLELGCLAFRVVPMGVLGWLQSAIDWRNFLAATACAWNPWKLRDVFVPALSMAFGFFRCRQSIANFIPGSATLRVAEIWMVTRGICSRLEIGCHRGNHFATSATTRYLRHLANSFSAFRVKLFQVFSSVHTSYSITSYQLDQVGGY